MDTSRVNVRTSDFDTVFFVRQAARSDSGEYELSVQIENMKDTATIRIRVVGARLELGGWGGVGWGIEQAQEQCKRPVRNGRGEKSEWGRGRGWRTRPREDREVGQEGGRWGRGRVGAVLVCGTRGPRAHLQHWIKCGGLCLKSRYSWASSGKVRSLVQSWDI